MKKTRQLFSLILAGMMLLSVVSAGAFADGESGVILMGTNLTANVYYMMGGAGLEAYAPDSQPGDNYAVLSSDGTLFLHNFRGNYIVSGDDPAAAGITISSSADTLAIHLEGDNEIRSDGYSATASGEEITCRSYGIYAPGKSITFSGDGSLNVISASLDGVSASYSESSAITAYSITAADSASVNAIAGSAQYSCGFNASSLSLSGTGASLTANAATAAFRTFPVSGTDGYEISVSSDYNQGLTGAGQAAVMLAQPYVEPEPYTDNRVPGIMPGTESCSVQACTTPENYDGAITLPEGWLYEYRPGTEGEYTEIYGNVIAPLIPGIYQVRLKETDQYLASDPLTFEVPAYTDYRTPGTMPGMESCSVQACTTPENYDGAITLPEGWLYEWRPGTEGEYTEIYGNVIAPLIPGTYQVRLKETDQYLASDPVTFEVPAYTDYRTPGTMPGTEYCSVQACTTPENYDGAITLPEGWLYEYRPGTEGEYTEIYGNVIAPLIPGTYQVRLKETDQYLASDPLTFEVPAYTDYRTPGTMPGTEYCSVQACTTPENYDGAITLPEGWLYEYRPGTEGEYTEIYGNVIAPLIPGTYQVRLKETDQYLASDPLTFEVPAYTDYRTPGIMPMMEKCYVQACTTSENNNGYIWLPDEPLGVQYQWRAGTEGEYQDTAGNGASDLAPGIYQIRLKETSEYLASAPLTFEILAYTDSRAPGTMPGMESCSVQSCTTSENNDGSIRLPEGGPYEWCTAGADAYQDVNGSSLSSLTPGTYLVRLKETAEYLASAPLTFEILAYTDSRAPGTMPGMESCSVQSCTTSENNDGSIRLPEGGPYEWCAAGADAYQDVNGSSLSSLAPGTYLVRLKETSEHLASEPLTFTVSAYTAPAVPDIPLTEDVVSVTVSPAPEKKKIISANIKLDTGDNALKAADTLMMLTNDPPAEKEDPPVYINFFATGSDSGYLSGKDLQAGQKYKIGKNGEYSLIEKGDLKGPDNIFPLTKLPGRCTIYIINPGDETENTTDSEPKVIEIYQFPKPSAEEVNATNATAYNPDMGSLYFIKAGDYAYRKGSEGAFSMLSGYDRSKEIRFACEAGTYEVCRQFKDSTLASESVTLTIRPYNAPDVSFEAESDCAGSVGSVTENMEYRLDKGEWTTVAENTDRIRFSNVTKGSSIEVCYSDTKDTTEIILDRQETPDSSIVKVTDCTNSSNNNGTITLDTDNYTSYEIRKGTSGSFTPVTAPKITDLSNGTYQLRTKASGNKLASNLCNAVIKEYIPPRGIDCQTISIQPYEKIFDTTDGYSTLTVSFYPYNTTNQTVTFSSSNEGVVNFGSQSRTVVGADGRASIRIYPVGSGEAKITATTANGKIAVCSTIVSFEYRFTYNKSGTWYYDKGGDYTVQTNGPMSRFSALKINGGTVNPQYYTTRANSDGTTILTISQYAMRSLSHGAYQKLQLVYNDGGTATTFLHILSVNDRPITGDDGNAVFWAAAGLSSLAALAAVSVWTGKARRKKNLF